MAPDQAAFFFLVFTLMVTTGATLILRGPLGKALAKRLEGRGTGPDDSTVAELAELRGRLQELEQQQDRIHELEERVDFAERLIAQQREQPRLNA
jgi:hypothetical protein